MAFKNIFLLFVCIAIAQGSPVVLVAQTDNAQTNTLSCIPTKWGCIDISDPSFRPKLNINDNKENPAPENHIRMCMPAPWGCIDISGPSVRPKETPKDDVLEKRNYKVSDMNHSPVDHRCKCIPTPYGCIDPCDPNFRP